jgi:hypothetical protein
MVRAQLFRFLFALLILGAIPLSPAPARAQTSDAAPTPVPSSSDDGVLVLNDGGVLRGRVSREGDRYVIVGTKSRVELAAGSVAVTSGSLVEAYEAQRRQMPHDTAEAHLALADWCLRYELVAEARDELDAARKLDPHSGKLQLLERRMAVASRSAGAKKAADDSATDDKLQTTTDVARLDALAAALPAGAVERFTRKVQPLLVNSCTTSGCHQVGGTQTFQLDRAVLHGLSNRRTTLTNLEATLALVNHDAPQLSPLLTIPRTEHAELKQPLLGPRLEQQYRQLEEWVAVVTGSKLPDEPNSDLAKAAADSGAKRMTAAERRSKIEAGRVALSEAKPFRVDSATTADAAGAKRGDAPTDPPLSGADSTIVKQAIFDEPGPFEQLRQRARQTPVLKSWEPKDAFDPEIFNRQYSNAANADKATANAADSVPAH